MSSLTEEQIRFIVREEFKRIIDTGFIGTEVARQPAKQEQEKKPNQQPEQPHPSKTLFQDPNEVLAEFPEDLRELLDVKAERDGWRINPRQFLASEPFRVVLDIVQSLGGKYVSAGRESHFTVPFKEAKT